MKLKISATKLTIGALRPCGNAVRLRLTGVVCLAAMAAAAWGATSAKADHMHIAAAAGAVEAARGGDMRGAGKSGNMVGLAGGGYACSSATATDEADRSGVGALSECGGRIHLEAQRQHRLDSLAKALKVSPSVSDSLAIMNDIFDVTARELRDSVGREIWRVAVRVGDERVGLDVLRNIGIYHMQSDSLLREDMAMAMKFPDSEERRETVALLKMFANLARMRSGNADAKDREFRSLVLALNDEDKMSVTDRVVALHALCVYIGYSSQGNLLSKYLDQLGTAVEQLDENAHALRNCYYSQAALAYGATGDWKKSIEINRRLLHSIDLMEHADRESGRKFRCYDAGRYVIYTRLLSYFPHLTDAEVEGYYRKVMEIVKHDDMAAATLAESGRPQIYYAMHHKEYAKAMELLRRYTDAPYNEPKRRLLLGYMIQCAKALGDNAALLEASQRYNELMDQTMDEALREKNKEIQMVYDINQIRTAHIKEQRRRERVLMVIAFALALMLGVIVAAEWALLAHSRRKELECQKEKRAVENENATLQQENSELMKRCAEVRRANRMKSDFIKSFGSEVAVPLHTINEYTNLIIDCSEAGYKPYLKHFAELISLNSDLLNTIVADSQSLSEIDSDTLAVTMGQEKLENVIEAAVENVRHRLRPGVTLEAISHDPDLVITTDARRLMQVLVQLLTNAAKFTREGRIEVDYTADATANRVTVTVTDSGPGVAAQYRDHIFERFVKLDRNAQGVGIGLAIARHLMTLLHGTVELDPTYHSGARFTVTLPLQ